MGLTKTQSGGLEDQSVTLDKLPHGTGSNDGKFLRANNGADPTFETVSTDLVADTSPQLGGNLDAGSHSIIFDDNSRVKLGNNNDIQIYHDGTDSHIDNATSNLRIASNDVQLRDNSQNLYIDCNNGGSVDLYHNGSKKLETTATGINVTGTLKVNGSDLPSNTPAFSAGPAVAQSGLTDNNNYKVSFTEIMDSDGKFSNGNLFRPQVAGYYAYYASCYMRSADSSAVYGFYLTIRKGNSDQSNQGGTAWYQDNEGGDRLMTNISGVMYLSSSDYIEVWASANTYGSGSVNWEILSGFGSFGAYKLIGV